MIRRKRRLRRHQMIEMPKAETAVTQQVRHGKLGLLSRHHAVVVGKATSHRTTHAKT